MRLPVSFLLTAAVLSPCFAQTFRGQIGAEVEIGEGNRSRAFVDLGKTWRPAENMSVDANGWPTTDFEFLFFHLSPVAAWFGSDRIDDPDRFVPDWSGSYKLSFKGQARITSTGDPVTISDQAYDGDKNLTTASVEVPKNTELLRLQLTDTRPNPNAAANTGVTDLKLIRPGYPADGSRVFTDEFLRSLEPYSHLRFMGVLDSNGADALDDKGNPILSRVKTWADRRLPNDATQQSYGAKSGLAWEYVVLLANETGKDIWINIPVSADDDYVRQLAQLLHNTLKPGVRIYLEHSNEVWNYGFSGYKWNSALARAEVAAGNSKLNQSPLPPSSAFPGPGDEIAQRRHIRRLIEISKMFLAEYGDEAFGTTVRPVYAGWIEFPDQYGRVLDWVKNNIGEPAKLIYAVAQTHYYSDETARTANATVDTVLAAFRASSDGPRPPTPTQQLHTVAVNRGLKHVIYEGGPDILRDSPTGREKSADFPGLFAAIGACRDARIKDIVTHDVRDNWFPLGGAEYTYFTASGGVSRYGCWGAVEDVVGHKASSPKLDAILELVGGRLPAPSITSVVNAASYQPPIAPGAFASIFGQGLADKTLDGWGGMVVGGRLPAVVGGVSVRVNGLDAVISFAGPGQINFIVPSGVSAGQATVEVITGGGRASATVEVVDYAPAFFVNALNGASQIAAQFANTAIYVAPPGAFPGVNSRAAKTGDILQIYATGLGLTNAPSGQVLTQPYEIDHTGISVTIDGVAAPVLWAGTTFAGVFQVNVQVPRLLRGGSLNVVLATAGQSTAGGVLTFAIE